MSEDPVEDLTAELNSGEGILLGLVAVVYPGGGYRWAWKGNTDHAPKLTLAGLLSAVQEELKRQS